MTNGSNHWVYANLTSSVQKCSEYYLLPKQDWFDVCWWIEGRLSCVCVCMCVCMYLLVGGVVVSSLACSLTCVEPTWVRTPCGVRHHPALHKYTLLLEVP